MHSHSITWRVLSRILGLLGFLVLLYVLNMYLPHAESLAFRQIVGFLNVNLLLIVGVPLVFLAGEIMNMLEFPRSAAAPAFFAVGAMLLAVLILRILELVGNIIDNPFGFLAGVITPIAIVVLVLVLVFGYWGYYVKHSERAGETRERLSRAKDRMRQAASAARERARRTLRRRER